MLTYFLQVNVCWLLFYGVYYALLSKETFFKLNRIWLIASLLCGLALPFAADYFAVKVVPTQLFVMTLEPFVVTATALQHNLATDTEGVVLKIVATIYGLGCAVLTMRFLAGLFLIFKLLKKSKRARQGGFRLVYTEGGVPPFSFFKFIFINPQAFESYDFQQIMQHEQAHVRQRHSFDVVFLELLNIVFWCSPLVYLYKTSLRNVHEYLADEAVLRDNAKAQYGRLLLRQRPSGMALSLTSNISNHFFSQLKKRILMMTRNKSKRTALIKYALAAPIFLILTAALASPKMPILAKAEALSETVVKAVNDELVDNQEVKSLNLTQKETPQYASVKVDTTTKPLSDLKFIDEKQIKEMNIDSKEEFNTQITITFKDGHVERYKGSKADMEKIFKKEDVDAAKVGYEPVFTIVEEQPQFADGQAALFKWLSQNIQYPKEAVDNKIEGTVYVGFIVNTDGSIADVTVKRGIGGGCNQEAMRVVSAMPNWKAGKQGGKAVRVAYTLPIKFKIDQNNINIETKTQEPNKVEAEKASTGTVYTVVEQNPEFPQGQAALFKWLGQNIKYPEIARRSRGEGTVYVGFVVETDGSITNVSIKRDAPVIVRDTVTIVEVNGIKGNKIVERTDYSLGKEAVRVISVMPKWKPGKQKGVPVRVAYTLPIKFKLE